LKWRDWRQCEIVFPRRDEDFRRRFSLC